MHYCYPQSLVLALRIITIYGSNLVFHTNLAFSHYEANTSYGLSTTAWFGVSSASDCGLQTTNRCPGAMGFLYDPATRQCTPMLWLHDGSGGTVVPPGLVDTIPGDLYLNQLNPGACRVGWEQIAYGSDGSYSCVRVLTPASTYDDATERCTALGGYLASVKTVEKLQMVSAIAQNRNMWIGLDDQEVEGVFFWQEDGEKMTLDQQHAVFIQGEPSNGNGQEHCCEYKSVTRNLNDVHCWAKLEALCESRPWMFTC